MQGLRKHAKMVRLRQKGSGKLSKAFIRGCDIRFALRKDPSGCCVKKKNKQTRLEQARWDMEQILQPFRGAEMVTWARRGAVKTENDE